MTPQETRTSASPGRRHVLKAVGSNALARMVALVVSAVLGIVVTRLIIEQYGEPAYAQYALLIGIGALIPFADLGIAASIMNVTAAAEDPRHDLRLRRTLVTSMRVLASSATVIVVVAFVLGATGTWEAVLGEGLSPSSGSLAATLVLVTFGCTLVVSFGQRLMGGLGLLQWTIVLQGLQTPMVLVVLLLMIRFDIGLGDYVAVVSYGATFVIGVITLMIANRLVRPVVLDAFREAFQLRRVRGDKVSDTAWPMLIQMIALPLAMQTDRIVLSHVSTLNQLTEYSLASQMFKPVVGVVSAAGFALWPIFAKARAHGVDSGVSPGRMSLLFGAVALVIGGMVGLASGILSEAATGGAIQLSLPLVIAFIALVVMQGLKYPLGMYMTDAAGLKFQAAMILMLLPINVAISIVLARSIGAAGPVIGSVITVAVFQVAANTWYVRRVRRVGVDGPAQSDSSLPEEGQ